MKITILAIGKKHTPDISRAIEDYSTRIARYSAFEWRILPPAKGKMGIDETKRAEGVLIAASIKDDDCIVLLDEGGTQLSSSELASLLGELEMQSVRRVVFIIGGAYGVTDELKRRADIIWSLSRLVFPHQLMRLLVAEQLYRAYTIRHGEPYHHE